MEVAQKLSLCPACGACPEVEILREDGRAAAVRIGESGEKVTIPVGAWNTLVHYIREGVLTTL
jgi:hypothetical protein